jgi:hypothetical protein
MDALTEYLQALQSALHSHPTVKVAWLTGSFGRGNADRYSDIDLNLWLEGSELDAFRQATQAWLQGIRPLVLFRWMFNDRMANALTADGLRLDLWLHTNAPTLDHERVHLLLDRTNRVQFDTRPTAPDTTTVAARLFDQIREFWRCIALTPAVIGREEYIVAVVGLTVEVNLLTDVVITGYGIPRDSGVKRLNPFLPAGLRAEIEGALAFGALTGKSLTAAHLALARIMMREGRQLATQHGFAYPFKVEEAALGYIRRELLPLDMVDVEIMEMKKGDQNL